MSRTITLISILFLLTFNSNLFSRTDDLINDYLESMFNCRFRDTKDLLKQLNTVRKNDIKTKLAFANFWMVMYETSGQNEKYHDLCKNEANSAVNILNAKKNKTYDDIFHIISAKSMLLKIQFTKKNYLKAAKDIKDIIQYFEYALDHEENIKMKLISGMYNYYIETAKEDYPIIYPVAIFYPSGNKQKGLKLIKECTKASDKSISIRSLLYLARIYNRDEKNIVLSSVYYKKLLELYPDNLIWRYEYIEALDQHNKKEESVDQKYVLTEKVKSSIHINEEQKQFFLK